MMKPSGSQEEMKAITTLTKIEETKKNSSLVVGDLGLQKSKHCLSFNSIASNSICEHQILSVMDLKNTLQYPPGTEALSIQVAGHVYGDNLSTGMLRHTESGDILKLVKEERFKREWDFYREIFEDDNQDDKAKVLRPLLPAYKGVFQLPNGDLFMRLGDVAFYGLNSSRPPSVMDIKIGRTTFGPDATEKKKADEKKKYRFQEELGFRVLGMMVFQPSDSKDEGDHHPPNTTTTPNYIRHGKEYGKLFCPSTSCPLSGYRDIVEAISTDYCHDDFSLLKSFRQALEPVSVWFGKHNRNRWTFASSSLLFAYTSTGSGEESSKWKVSVKMIDFAHVSPNTDSEHPLDENYIHGLEQLIATFDRAIERLQNKK